MVALSEPSAASVAVLDDDVRFIRMVERVLDAEGIDIQPITTIDLEEAERVVAQGPCSMALIDIMMYGQAAGFELVERLRKNPATQSMPIVVTSGAKRELGRHVDFLRDNGCAVLLKPFCPDDLLAQIHAADAPDAAAGHHGADARVVPFVPRRATAET